jgi:para-nitrobenzyl esterase
MRSLFAACTLSLCCLPPVALLAQPAPQVHVAQGEIEGAVTPQGILVFKGIPYAAPPVGDLRWREPQPATAWARMRNVKAFSPACMQPASGFNIPHSEMSEDCLYLNIWTSSLTPPQPAPVMVYIHGGGFTVGSASNADENGISLAQRGAIVVTINYRLGVFGFMAHPDLTRESTHHASGNYGLMDQLAALRWVRENIAAFGGNAHNVTVFGESAGASSIGYLLISPLATGLFDKAILESPSNLFTPDPELQKETHGLTSMEAVGMAIAPSVADLRKLSSDELLARAQAATDKLFGPGGSGRVRIRPEGHTQNPSVIDTPWWGFVDGYVVPAQHAKLYAEERGARIPVMVGTNANEGSVFLGQFEPKTVDAYNAYVTRTFAPCGKPMLELYPAATPNDIHTAAERLLNDALFLYGAFSVAQSEHAFLYRFSHVSPEDARNKLGTPHGAEIPYVFGLTRNSPEHFTSADHRLSDQMMTAWLYFARTGDPRLMKSSLWTRIGSNGEVPYMDFNDTPTVKDLPDTTFRVFRDLWPASGKPSSCRTH